MKLGFKFILLVLLFCSLNANSLEKLTLQLNWKDQFEFAGYYMAKEKGFYKDVGLDVEFKNYQFDLNIVQQVTDNSATYGIGGSDLIVDISNGSNIILMSAIFQSSPLVLLTTEKSGIKSIEDFKNKKVMLSPDTLTSVTYNAMLKKKNLSFSDMKVVNHTFDINDLINEKVDLFQSYITNEPFQLIKANLKPIVFDPKDYGFDFFSDILFTSSDEIKNHLQRAIKFRDASLKGWRYAFDNIEESIDIILEKYNSQNRTREALLYEANESKKLAYYENIPLGDISQNKIERMYDAYNIMNFIKNPIDIKKYILPTTSTYNSNLIFSEKEKEYLKNEALKICIAPNWMPLEAIDEKNMHTGMGADIKDIIEKRINKKIDILYTNSWSDSLNAIKNEKCQILSLSKKTKSRSNYLNFTQKIFKIPYVIVTKRDKFFIDNFDEIKNNKFAVVKSYAIQEDLKEFYPNTEVVEVEDIEQGLQLVQDGKVYGYIDTTASIGYAIDKNEMYNLKIIGKMPIGYDLSYGVIKEKTELLSILEKAISTISKEERERIYRKWIAIENKKVADYSLIWQIVSFSLFIILLLGYWNRKVLKSKKELEKANELLELAKLEIKNKNKILEKLAITDKLTKIYNRSKLDEIIKDELNRANRFETTFALCLLDIDYFKSVNDTYGHIVGDKVLVSFATLLKNSIRETDYVGRWGGEEFVFIITNTNQEQLLHFTEKIRKKIESHNFDIVKNKTASFGVTLFKKGDDIETIIKRADDALYKAKKSGRNRICFL